MENGNRSPWLVAIGAGLMFSLLGTGCASMQHADPAPDSAIPRELDKVTLPPYVIEPPDTLIIDAIRLVPLPPYRIEPLDQLVIQASGVYANEPIAGIFPVEPEWTLNLGVTYGQPKVLPTTMIAPQTALENSL